MQCSAKPLDLNFLYILMTESSNFWLASWWEMRPSCMTSNQGQSDSPWSGIMQILHGKTGSVLYTVSKVMGTVFRGMERVDIIPKGAISNSGTCEQAEESCTCAPRVTTRRHVQHFTAPRCYSFCKLWKRLR
jgi:hypothetical protein